MLRRGHFSVTHDGRGTPRELCGYSRPQQRQLAGLGATPSTPPSKKEFCSPFQRPQIATYKSLFSSRAIVWREMATHKMHIRRYKRTSTAHTVSSLLPAQWAFTIEKKASLPSGFRHWRRLEPQANDLVTSGPPFYRLSKKRANVRERSLKAKSFLERKRPLHSAPWQSH